MTAPPADEPEHLLRKLTAFLDLPPAQRRKLADLCQAPRRVAAGTVLVEEGEASYTGFVLTAGWAARERTLQDGSRQIISYMVPGDLSEPGAFVTDNADHTIRTVTEATLRPFRHDVWFGALYNDGILASALWWMAAHEEAVLKEHVVAIGRRDPRRRLLYLLWELYRRLQLVGLCQADTFDLPLSQTDMADTLGLSTRHLSRVLAGFSHEGIVDLTGGRVTIHDRDRLLEAADCRDVYLQITTIGRTLRRILAESQPSGG